MARTVAQVDGDLKSLEARVRAAELDLRAAQQDLKHIQATLERWGNRAWQIALAVIAAGLTSVLAVASAFVLFLVGIKKL